MQRRGDTSSGEYEYEYVSRQLQLQEAYKNALDSFEKAVNDELGATMKLSGEKRKKKKERDKAKVEQYTQEKETAKLATQDAKALMNKALNALEKINKQKK